MNTDPKMELPKKILQLTKKEPTNESLIILQKYTDELEGTLRAKEECLEELNSEKSKKEIDIKFAQCLISNKDEELKNVKLAQKIDSQTEEEWANQVKRTRKNNIASMEEYQTKMAGYREQLLSSTGFNDEVINEKINETEKRKVDLAAEIASMEKGLIEIQNIISDCKESIERQICMMQILTKHCQEEGVCDAQVLKFENQLHSLMQQIEQVQSKPE